MPDLLGLSFFIHQIEIMVPNSQDYWQSGKLKTYSTDHDIWKTLNRCWMNYSKLFCGNGAILITSIVKMIGLELFLVSQWSRKRTTNAQQEAVYKMKLYFQHKSQQSKCKSAINTFPKPVIQSNIIKSSSGICHSWVFMSWFWKEFPVWVRILTCHSTFTRLTRYKEAILNNLEYNLVINVRYQFNRLC